MYNRQRSRPSLIILILFAVVAGIIYFVLDNTSESPVAEISPTNVAANNPESTIPVTVATDEQPEVTQENTSADGFATPEVITTPDEASATINEINNNFESPIPPDTALFIPSAGIYAPIVQTYLDGVSWDVSQLGTNVGHLQGTAWIDTPGNVVLSGHVELSDGRQGVFANLNEVAVGDIIVIVMNGDEWRYIITEIGSTTPQDLQPIYPTSEPRLTLITCEDYDFISNSYLERTIIVAERII